MTEREERLLEQVNALKAEMRNPRLSTCIKEQLSLEIFAECLYSATLSWLWRKPKSETY